MVTCFASLLVAAASLSQPIVKTVSLRNPDLFMAPPVIRLGTDDRLQLDFDIIGDEPLYLRYSLTHCNADWKPSRLLESEFLNSFNEGHIDDFAYSSNTFVHYVNYSLTIPNEEINPIASGNYIIKVYDEDDPAVILIEQRFMVTENIVPIKTSLTSRTDLGFNDRWQQLAIAADVNGIATVNPYQDVIVTVTQNNDPLSTATLTHPTRTDGRSVIYEHQPQLVFDAGNEYRRFETVRTDYPGMGVDSVSFEGTNWHAWLQTDRMRAGHEYTYDVTQHGRFMVDDYNSTDPNLGADYVTVHFTLDIPEMPGADIYVDGDLTRHTFTDRNRMTYDREREAYTLQLPLKQGSYNYRYVVRPPGSSSISASPVEGDLYETRNEYLVNVYLRLPLSRGDRLVGTALVQP